MKSSKTAIARWSEIFYLGEDTSIWVGLASKCRYLCTVSKTRSYSPVFLVGLKTRKKTWSYSQIGLIAK